MEDRILKEIKELKSVIAQVIGIDGWWLDATDFQYIRLNW